MKKKTMKRKTKVVALKKIMNHDGVKKSINTHEQNVTNITINTLRGHFDSIPDGSLWGLNKIVNDLIESEDHGRSIYLISSIISALKVGNDSDSRTSGSPCVIGAVDILMAHPSNNAGALREALAIAKTKRDSIEITSAWHAIQSIDYDDAIFRLTLITHCMEVLADSWHQSEDDSYPLTRMSPQEKAA